jgi:tripartite-type tricarboxylate transporter receptor subunit TctC
MPDLEIASSTGILAPVGTPVEVIGLLEKTLRDIANDADMAKTFRSYGADADFMDAAQYRSYMEREIQRWTMVGQKANIKVK